MIYIDVEKDEFYNQAKYALEELLRITGITYKQYELSSLSENDILITYGRRNIKVIGCKNLHIKNCGKLFNDFYKTEKTLPKDVFNYEDVFSFYSNSDLNIVIHQKDFIEINIDIISDIFFMLSRYEEYIIGNSVENHKRFSYKDSIFFKEKLMNRPLVNEYANLLFDLLKKLDNNIISNKNLKDKDFILLISHDIDSIFKYKDKALKNILIKIIKERDLKGAYKLIRNYIKVMQNLSSDPYWTFDYLTELEKKYDMSASYYFMSGGNSWRDNYYKISNKNLKSVMKKIKDQGSEIGLHGSFNSYNNRDYLKKEKEILSKYANVKGIRQHFLRFSAPNTWIEQASVGLEYDSTVGYAEIPGFRCGICTPFKPFDLNNNCRINIWEIPLIVMDTTLNNNSYQGFDIDQAVEYCNNMVDVVRKYNGVFSLLWHNSSFDNEGDWKGWNKVYEKIIKYSISKNALCISGEKVIELVKITEEKGGV
ncbi:polysaccharide deacetylase family protein [Clostridium sp.]|uniref:polysaccharide deacetylase family protein n=1 Tax=Clostridium sp. TaxID=1506 RepID=UPI003216C093